MKNILTLLVFAITLSMNAQTADSLQTTNKPTLNFNADFDGYKYASQFKNVLNSKSKLAFSVYNETTKLNDVSFISNDKVVYMKPNLLLENQYRGSKIDSFNPYGAPDVKYGVVLGVVNSLLNKN